MTNKNGESAIGAVKIHICKKVFSLQMAEMVSTQLYEFLRSVYSSDEFIAPELCFTLDVFAGRVVSAQTAPYKYGEIVRVLCSEIVDFWDAA